MRSNFKISFWSLQTSKWANKEPQLINFRTLPIEIINRFSLIFDDRGESEREKVREREWESERAFFSRKSWIFRNKRESKKKNHFLLRTLDFSFDGKTQQRNSDMWERKRERSWERRERRRERQDVFFVQIWAKFFIAPIGFDRRRIKDF